MSAFTAPLESAFALQRTLIQKGHETVETGLEFQTGLNRALVDGLEDQEDIQRRFLALHHVVLHRIFDSLDEQLPGAHLAIDDFRDVVDEQFDQLYDNHEEVFENLVDELEDSVDACDDVGVDYLDALDDQLDLLVDAQEELETQSVEAAEQFDDQIDSLQTDVVSLQTDVVDLREQVDAVTP